MEQIQTKTQTQTEWGGVFSYPLHCIRIYIQLLEYPIPPSSSQKPRVQWISETESCYHRSASVKTTRKKSGFFYWTDGHGEWGPTHCLAHGNMANFTVETRPHIKTTISPGYCPSEEHIVLVEIQAFDVKVIFFLNISGIICQNSCIFLGKIEFEKHSVSKKFTILNCGGGHQYWKISHNILHFYFGSLLFLRALFFFRAFF